MRYDDYLPYLINYLEQTALESVLDILEKKYPWISIPIIRPIALMAIKKIVNILVRQSKLLVYFKHIDLKTSAQGKEFYDAINYWHAIKDSGTSQEIADARRHLEIAADDFIIIGR